MSNKIPLRELDVALHPLIPEHDIMPFITMKFLSQKQEEYEDINQFQEKYGFTFRDYELLSNITKKLEEKDTSYTSDMRSSINALKNSKTPYIKEIYDNIPEKTLKDDILEKILNYLKIMDDTNELYRFMNFKLRHVPRRFKVGNQMHLIQLMVEIVKIQHKTSKIYDPSCRNAGILNELEFDKAVLYEKDKRTYSEAIQNMIIHEIPLEKVSIKNEQIEVDETTEKYDTIISVPYYERQQKLYTPDKFKEYKTKDPNSLHLLNLIDHLDKDGIIVTETTSQLLSRKDGETLRKCLIERNLIDAVIELGKTIHAIESFIIILKNNKTTNDVLFIKQPDLDLRKLLTLEEDILECYKNRQPVPKYCDIITNEEIKKNDYNLHPKRYVYTLDYETQKMEDIISEQKQYDTKIRQLDEEIDELLEEIRKI